MDITPITYVEPDSPIISVPLGCTAVIGNTVIGLGHLVQRGKLYLDYSLKERFPKAFSSMTAAFQDLTSLQDEVNIVEDGLTKQPLMSTGISSAISLLFFVIYSFVQHFRRRADRAARAARAARDRADDVETGNRGVALAGNRDVTVAPAPTSIKPAETDSNYDAPSELPPLPKGRHHFEVSVLDEEAIYASSRKRPSQLY